MADNIHAMFDTETNQALVSFDFFDYCFTSINKNQSLNSAIKVHPNPVFSDEIKIINAPMNSNWELYDISGEIISKGAFENNEQINIINLKAHSTGIFFLSIFSKHLDRRHINKIIKP